jgi:hypothetical protein
MSTFQAGTLGGRLMPCKVPKWPKQGGREFYFKWGKWCSSGGIFGEIEKVLNFFGSIIMDAYLFSLTNSNWPSGPIPRRRQVPQTWPPAEDSILCNFVPKKYLEREFNLIRERNKDNFELKPFSIKPN